MLIEPDGAEEMPLSTQQAALLLALRGSLRREIEEGAGVTLEV